MHQKVHASYSKVIDQQSSGTTKDSNVCHDPMWVKGHGVLDGQVTHPCLRVDHDKVHGPNVLVNNDEGGMLTRRKTLMLDEINVHEPQLTLVGFRAVAIQSSVVDGLFSDDHADTLPGSQGLNLEWTE